MSQFACPRLADAPAYFREKLKAKRLTLEIKKFCEWNYWPVKSCLKSRTGLILIGHSCTGCKFDPVIAIRAKYENRKHTWLFVHLDEINFRDWLKIFALCNLDNNADRINVMEMAAKIEQYHLQQARNESIVDEIIDQALVPGLLTGNATMDLKTGMMTGDCTREQKNH